jgi:hypothetical protein
MLVAGHPRSIGIHIYVFTVESQQPLGEGPHHVRSYCGNPTAQAGKTHPFT